MEGMWGSFLWDQFLSIPGHEMCFNTTEKGDCLTVLMEPHPSAFLTFFWKMKWMPPPFSWLLLFPPVPFRFTGNFIPNESQHARLIFIVFFLATAKIFKFGSAECVLWCSSYYFLKDIGVALTLKIITVVSVLITSLFLSVSCLCYLHL